MSEERDHYFCKRHQTWYDCDCVDEYFEAQDE